MQRLTTGLGLGKKSDLDKDTEDRMRESERGINEKIGENGKRDEAKSNELIWREIVSHHTAIELLQAKESRENVASCIILIHHNHHHHHHTSIYFIDSYFIY